MIELKNALKRLGEFTRCIKKVIKYNEKCNILIKSRYKVKSPLSEKVTYNLYHFSAVFCLLADLLRPASATIDPALDRCGLFQGDVRVGGVFFRAVTPDLDVLRFNDLRSATSCQRSKHVFLFPECRELQR